jgi:maltose alpha-D-glucosyltransferase / alpha-amylase
MIALRKLFQVFGRGTLRFLNPENRKILAYLRDLDRGDGSHETVLCVANLSRFAQPVSLDLADLRGLRARRDARLRSIPKPLRPHLAPYSFLWLELQPASRTPCPPHLGELQKTSCEPGRARS